MSVKSRVERLERLVGDEDERVIIALVHPDMDATDEEINAIIEERTRGWSGAPNVTAIVAIEQEDVDAYRRRHGGGS